MRKRTWTISICSALMAVGVLTGLKPRLVHQPARHHARLATRAIGSLPVTFEPNVGQSSARVRYLARGRASTIYLTARGAVVALRRGASRENVVGLTFAGANSRARVRAAGRLAGVSNYLLGNDPARWRTHVPHFAGVRYDRLYPGIGLAFHGAAGGGLEYDFHVGAGADPNRIRLAYAGVRKLDVAPNGDLVLHMREGDLRQPRPRAWQTRAGARRLVPVAYRLHGDTVSFRLGGYDRSRSLLIDPKVVYASYFGGSGDEGCGPVPGGDDGSLVVSCGTDSPNLPRVGASQAFQGQEDIYIAKLNHEGTRVLWATYLGSPGQDEDDQYTADARGNVYFTGFAGNGFPTTPGAYDRTYGGGELPGDPADGGGCCGDAVAGKLSSDGSRLIYSTYLGGSGTDRTNSLALDHDGSIVVTGMTGSSDFPTTPGAVQSKFGGGNAQFEAVPVDAFATKLDPSGARLVYSTYLGGSADDIGNTVALDDAGNAYYVGDTSSPDFPTTPGSLKSSIGTPTPIVTAYVTKLAPDGHVLWSTFLGGQFIETGWGIDVDRERDVVVSGATLGGFPVTAGTAQPTFGGVVDFFVAKLDRSGAKLDWATYLGGSDFDGFTPTVRVDRKGNADVVGPTAATDFPTTAHAFQKTNAGGFDLGIAQLDRKGRLLFSSYLGGSGDDDGGAQAVDDDGNFYVGGVTSSSDLPVTPGAIQRSYGGGHIDGLLLKVAFDASGPSDQGRDG